MTVTSTYDHRIIQGAESGLFLARMEDLLKGQDGFFERIFDDLGCPTGPCTGRSTPLPAWAAPRVAARRSRSRRRSCSSSTPTACAATSSPTSTPSTRKRAPHKDLDPATYGLTLWDLDREFITERPLGQGPGHACARSWRCCATPTAAPSASSTCTSPTPSARSGCRTRMESARNYPGPRRAEQEAHPREARGGRELRALPAHEVRRPQALLPRGGRGPHSACSTAS